MSTSDIRHPTSDIRRLKIGLPAGSLQESTLDLFRRAGFPMAVSQRSYLPQAQDEELDVVLVRAQEIPTYVAHGVFDAGLTGYDWICECQVQPIPADTFEDFKAACTTHPEWPGWEMEVVEVAELAYAKHGVGSARWVLVVPAESEVTRVEDLQGKRIATELVWVTKGFLGKRGVEAYVEFSWGATEVKLRTVVDAIVELTETGASLRANNLREIEEVLTTTPRLIAYPPAWEDPWKRAKLENIAMLVEGALLAEGKAGLKMNVRRLDLDRVVALLPALQNPTVSDLADGDWVAVETVIDERIARTLIPELRRAGASGIIEYPLNKVIL